MSSPSDSPRSGSPEAELPPTEAVDVDRLLTELRERIERRRRDGAYPPDLEEQLDAHFARLVDERPAPSPALYDQLERAIDALDSYVYSRERIEPTSEFPGGSYAHRVIGKIVSRQIHGVLEQSQQYAIAVNHTIATMANLLVAVGRAYDQVVVQQLDDLQVRIAEQQRSLAAAQRKLDETAMRFPGAALEPFYREDRFTAHFRGDVDEVTDRYRDLADELIDCSPVLEIGFGRGEFMELLRQRGVETHGIEPDRALVETAQGRGLDVEVGRAVEYLERLEPGGLGGIAMIQVIEHLSPQHVIDVVRLAARALRPGGPVSRRDGEPRVAVYVCPRAVDRSRPRPAGAPRLLALRDGRSRILSNRASGPVARVGRRVA